MTTLSNILQGTADLPSNESSQSMIYLAYARVSTDDQEKAGQSLPAQVKEMKLYAKSKGIQLIGIYEEAESAFSKETNRPKFQEMISLAKSDPRITGILVHDFSRFFRDPYLGPMVKGELKQHGVRVVSATEPEFDSDTVSGLAIEKMLEFKNASYSMDIAFHTRKGMRENITRRDQEIGYCYKNGGSPPWGFKGYRVQRGTNGHGDPIMKTLWEKNDQIVSGRRIWEWTHYVLTEMRLKRASSLDSIRDFLNEKGIPSPRKKYWGVSSIHSLLQPSALLQFAGYGVWNVHGKKGKKNPPSEWVIVENAHPAIISMDEAEEIMKVNEKHSKASNNKSKKQMSSVRSKGSRYILSGGLFICRRCGENMVGHINRNRSYYMCGANVYRKGLGCGRAFQVPKEEIENAALEEIGQFFNTLADDSRLKNLMTEELKTLEIRESSDSANIVTKLEKVVKELENLRNAIKGGLKDIQWANEEYVRLSSLKNDLQLQKNSLGVKPKTVQVNKSMVEKCRKAFKKILSQGTRAEKKEFTRLFIKKIELYPETGDILMHLFSRPPGLFSPPNKGIPGTFVPGMSFDLVAGTGFEPATFGL